MTTSQMAASPGSPQVVSPTSDPSTPGGKTSTEGASELPRNSESSSVTGAQDSPEPSPRARRRASAKIKSIFGAVKIPQRSSSVRQGLRDTPSPASTPQRSQSVRTPDQTPSPRFITLQKREVDASPTIPAAAVPQRQSSVKKTNVEEPSAEQAQTTLEQPQGDAEQQQQTGAVEPKTDAEQLPNSLEQSWVKIEEHSTGAVDAQPESQEAVDSSNSNPEPERKPLPAPITIDKTSPVEKHTDASPEIRARSRSRSTDRSAVRRRQLAGVDSMTSVIASGSDATDTRSALTTEAQMAPVTKPRAALLNGSVVSENGHLSPKSAAVMGARKRGMGRSYWREISRSPSPLGLIPIHREWREFINRNEIPRKILHISIGFITLYLFCAGRQAVDIHPPLLAAFLVIFFTDVLRHNVESFNRFYIRVLGAWMREREAHDAYNGVIWYIAGAWGVLRFCPKDVAVMSIVLLSWCDTAASTAGRRWGRYTPRVRRGKSLAGSLAATVVGFFVALLFWGWLAPLAAQKGWSAPNTGSHAFAFNGELRLPGPAWLRSAIGCLPHDLPTLVQEASNAGNSLWTRLLNFGSAPPPPAPVITAPALFDATSCKISGWPALLVLSAYTGIVASASEAIDLFGWDDNLTIPLLSGAGLWAALSVFGAAT